MKFEGLAADLAVRKIFKIFAGTMGRRALEAFFYFRMNEQLCVFQEVGTVTNGGPLSSMFGPPL
jgi:5-keto 4-deoxyuronate isomerase